MWNLFGTKGGTTSSSSGFSASSTAEQVTQGIDGCGLTAIVTGASCGIGAETARVLALRGVRVFLAVRNLEAGNRVKQFILKDNPSANVDALELDLGSLASVKNFASHFNSLDLPLNILINNAGVMGTPFTLSKDKIELQFAVNHLGHFLLTNLLLDNIKKTAKISKREGRIVNVSSRRHNYSYPEGIRFDKINDPSGYDGMLAYGQSKLANVLHANELARRFKEEGAEVTANSIHPGFVATNLFRHYSLLPAIVNLLGKFAIKNVQQGAATTCYVALHPQVKGLSGHYFADSDIAEMNSKAKDVNLMSKLWEFSSDLVNRRS